MQNKIKNRKTKCHIRTCSGYPEKWIPGINPRMTECEQGRSMVEMLGVLAVMGVLSVGGVAMYTNAMNKYRANELLNESSKRAVVIATQILSGKSVSSDMINQFDNNGTTFTGVEAVGTNQFKLTLSGVDDDVCTQLKATVGSNTIIQEVGDKCAFLTFNNDLSKGTTSSGTNGGSNGGNEQQEPVVDPCEGFTATACITVCTNNNGVAQYTYAEEGTSCDANGTSACDGNGTCNQCPVKGYVTIAKDKCTFSIFGEEARLVPNVPGCYCPDGTAWNYERCSMGGGSG